MKHIICLFFLSVYSTWAQTAICIGERFTLPSTIMGGERTIDLYLPPSYNDSSLTPTDYPVVYLLDAQTNFNYFTTLMEKLTQGVPNIPEMIVVGIESKNRDGDFAAENDRFWQFVSEEVKPLVERKYRCKDFRIAVGHSLSGLSVVSALIKHTDLFNAYIAHDPSLWWGEGYGINLFEQNKGKDFQNRLLYITHTGYKIRHNCRSGHVATFDKLKEMLQANAFKNLQWKISEYSKENHGTIQLIGNIDMFRTLFAEMFIDRNDIEENPQVITQRYKALSERLHYTFTPSEGYLRNTIKWLQRNGKQAQAQEVEALLRPKEEKISK